MRLFHSRRSMLGGLLLALSLIVACGPGEICGPTRAEQEAQDLANYQALARLQPPFITRIDATLAAPVTTYTVSATNMANQSLTFDWSMTGEACGTPVVPWKQSGASVRWSHSDQSPDNCQHKGTDHAVVATVVVRTDWGLGVECSITGTETQKIEYPSCKPAAPR